MTLDAVNPHPAGENGDREQPGSPGRRQQHHAAVSSRSVDGIATTWHTSTARALPTRRAGHPATTDPTDPADPTDPVTPPTPANVYAAQQPGTGACIPYQVGDPNRVEPGQCQVRGSAEAHQNPQGGVVRDRPEPVGDDDGDVGTSPAPRSGSHGPVPHPRQAHPRHRLPHGISHHAVGHQPPCRGSRPRPAATTPPTRAPQPARSTRSLTPSRSPSSTPRPPQAPARKRGTRSCGTPSRIHPHPRLDLPRARLLITERTRPPTKFHDPNTKPCERTVRTVWPSRPLQTARPINTPPLHAAQAA
jgi:hypothetical protein